MKKFVPAFLRGLFRRKPTPVGLPVSARARRIRTGQRVLWGILLIMFAAFFVRGLADWFASPAVPAVRASDGAAGSSAQDAQRVAAAFAHVFLSYSPARVEQQQRELEGMLADDVSADDAITPATRPQRVLAAWPGKPRFDRRLPGNPRGAFRAAVVVTCIVERLGTTRMVHLSVPVISDGDDGFVVAGNPAPMSAAALATNVRELPQQALSDADTTAIGPLLTRFFDQYLTGDEVIPELLTPAASRDERIRPLGQRLQLVNVERFAQIGIGAATSKWIAVTVTARDTKTRAKFTFDYRLRVIYRDGRPLVDTLTG